MPRRGTKVGGVTTPTDYGISPEVLALAEAADRQARQFAEAAEAADRRNRQLAGAVEAAVRRNQSIADAAEAADRRNRQLAGAVEAASRHPRLLANIGPVMSIIERQHNAMEAMRSSFEQTMRVQSPVARQALAAMVRQLREDPPSGVALAAEARAAESAILALVGQELAPEQIGEVQQGAEEVDADPELSGKLRHLVDRVDWSEAGTLTPWAALCVAAVILFKVADTPVTEQLSAAQTAALANWLMVLSIIVALAAIIVTIQKK